MAVTGSLVSDDAFTFIDLFAGVGGFHAALSELGGRCVYVAEKDEYAASVYKKAWIRGESDVLFSDDINEDVRVDSSHTIDELLEHARSGNVNLGKIPKGFDVLTAGFPCQAFSKSGKQLGVLDKVRGTLFYNILVVVAIRRPKIVFLENVKNLVGPRHRDTTFRTIVTALRDLKYVVSDDPTVFSPHFLAPEHGGGPQSRERVYILAVRSDLVDDAEPFTGPTRSPDWSAEGWLLAETHLGDGAPAAITDAWLDAASGDPARAARAKELSDLRGDVKDYKLSPEEDWFKVYDSLVKAVTRSRHHQPNKRGSRFPGHPIWFDVTDLAWRRGEREDATLRGRPWKTEFIDKSLRFVSDYVDVLDKPDGAPLLKRIMDLNNNAWRKFEWQAQDATTLRECLIQLRPSGVRVKKATYTPALVAINQAPILGKDRRRLTPYEAGRLQGFPDRVYEAMRESQPDGQSYKQFGNAVHVGTVQFALVRLMKHHFGDVEGEAGLGRLGRLTSLLDRCREHAAWKIDESSASVTRQGRRAQRSAPAGSRDDRGESRLSTLF